MTNHVAAKASFWPTFVLSRHLVSCGLASLALLFVVGCQTSRTSFYPIGIYSEKSTNELSVLRDAGFNLVTGAANRAFLDAANRSSLRVLASPGASAGTNFNAERVRRTVTEFDSHPALWAWYVIDEPDMNRVSPKDVQGANRFIKNLPGSKLTALVLYQDQDNTDESHVYRFELPRPMAGEMPVLDEGREITIGGNWVEDEFAPYAIHVYGPFGRME